VDSEKTVRVGDPDSTVVLGDPDRTVRLGPDLLGPASRPAAALVVSAAVRRPAPPRVSPPAGRDRLARLVASVDLTQVVCWQVAVLAVVLTAGRPMPVPLGAIAAAAVLGGLTAVRVRGRWGYQVAGAWLRFLLRPKRHELSEPAALVEVLLPGSAVRTVPTGPDELPAISHVHGLTAVLRPVGSLPDPGALLPAVPEPQVLGVQAVFHTGAKRAAPIDVWLAVHAARTVEDGLDEELTLLLHNALRRVRRSLRRAGVVAEAPAADELFTKIAELAYVTRRLREDWGFVRTGPVSQACFVLDGWDRLPAGVATRLVAEVHGRTGGVLTTLALSATSGPHGIRTRAVLRLAAPTEFAIEHTAIAVAGLLGPAGVGLVRLDGDQLSGMAASLPIGGFLT
jgi:ESX secretion system protein EccE